MEIHYKNFDIYLHVIVYKNGFVVIGRVAGRKW